MLGTHFIHPKEMKASQDLAQTSYIMATTSLHMTTMCLMYKPTLVACVCIHLACKWLDWQIEPCSEGREWFYYVDGNVNLEKLEALTDRFIAIMETSPHRFKKKFGQKDVNYHGPIPRSLMEEPSTSKAGTSTEKYNDKQDLSSPGPSSLSYDFADFDEKPLFKEKSPAKSVPQPLSVQPSVKPSTPIIQPPSSALPVASTPLAKKLKEETPHSISLDVYREKKEKERLHNKVSASPSTLPPTESSVIPPQITKKPQLAFHETDKASHRTSVKHADLLSVSSKERVKVKEDPIDPSTSVNKLNHQMVKPNSDGSHYKERSNYSHNSKIAHQANDTVIKQEKNDLVIKHEKVETKQERNDVIRPERLDIVKVEKMEHSKPEKADLIKQEKTDSFRPEKIEVKVESKNSSLPVAAAPIVIHRQSHKEENVVLEVKKEKKEKHKKHSSHSSKEKSVSNHLDRAPPSGIIVKIPKTIINLSGIVPESSQKYPPLPVKPESPKRSIKIKLPKPPEHSKGAKPPPSASIKLVITKDKSGTGFYSTSHKNERDRESRKRMHSNSIYGNGNAVCDVPSSKYQKVDHFPFEVVVSSNQS